MISIPKIFSKIFLNDENKLLTGFSFFIISLICLHFIFYLNFYNFSGDWIERESKLVTVQILPSKEEKKVPISLESKVLDFFIEKPEILNADKIEDETVKESLGLDNINSFSSLRLPLIIQITLIQSDILLDFSELNSLIEGRTYDHHYHKSDLVEIYNLINKVNLFIFLFGLVITILFIFLLTLLLKSTLVNNYNFLKIIEIMGADSKVISISLSVIIIRKMFLGSFLGMIFSIVISNIIIGFFDIPGNNFFELFSNPYLSNFLLLLIFLLFVLAILFFYFIAYLIYFLEKRFFN